MAQSTPRFCSQCGSLLEAGHRFCTNCGATTDIGSNNPTALATDEQATLASNAAQNPSSPVATIPAAKSAPSEPTIMTANADSTVGAPISTPATPNAPGTAAIPATPAAPAPNVAGATYSTVPAPGDQFYAQDTQADVIPPPPPPDSFVSSSQQSQASSYYTPPAPGYAAVPDYARVPKRSRAGLVAIVLLLVLVLGGVGLYFAFFRHPATNNNQNNNGAHTQQNTASTTGNTPVSSGSNNGTPASSGPTAEQLNLQFTYASIQMTISSVQEAQSLPGDNNTSQGGLVRITMMENNPTTHSGNFAYGDVAHLRLPDGTTTPAVNSQNPLGPDASTNRTNWLDFAVPSSNLDLSRLVLIMGTASENQMGISLMPTANLSKYQPKTIAPNTMVQYAGLNWTITSVTESLSADNQQAAKGQVFIEVTLSATNSTGSDFNAYPGDYIRLKAGDTTSSPTANFTFPLSIASQSTGRGTVTFLMPQGNASFTLMMLARPTSPPINAASATFQIR